MEPWAIDAREVFNDLDKVSQIDDELIEQTGRIKEFLESDRYHFLIATKGLGKSLLLLAKRKRFQEQQSNTVLIPEHTPLDVPSVNLSGLNKGALTLLKKKDVFVLIWSLSIAIAIIKRLNLTIDNKNISDSLKKILESQIHKTISDIFGFIINDMNRKQIFKDLRSDYNSTLVPAIRTIEKPVAAFIDNVDECFNSDRDIWYIAQTSLIVAIYNLIRINSHIKLFASIRKEAYLKLKTQSEMGQQYESVSLILSYSKNELREIFIKNIKKERENRLIKKNLRNSEPLVAFVGFDKVQHGYVHEEEDTFDYIYRHTLRRPRDLMEIGFEISNEISNYNSSAENLEESRWRDRFKEIVNNKATNIAEQYIAEVTPHLTIKTDDLDKIYELIDSNILEERRLREICKQFNNVESCKSCKECFDKIHIFCELYKIGLLGYVDTNPIQSGQYIQKFEPIGEKIFHDVRLLPKSNHYLIHPILDQLIRNRNSRYGTSINTINIVGYERLWRTHAQVPQTSIRRPEVFISSTMDLVNLRNALAEVIENRGFTVIRSETINSPHGFERLKELAESCHIFVAVLGPRYGDEVDGKSICEHEFDAAYNANPQKIIVYIVRGNIDSWEEKQQQFVKKVQDIKSYGFARGERVDESNIRDRFEKDLTERITILLESKNKEERS